MIYEKVLLVEGDNEQWVLPEFIEKNGVIWGDKRNNRIVEIKPFHGKEKLNRTLLNMEIEASGLRILGIILDADDSPDNTWKSVRNLLAEKYPDIPKDLHESGLIYSVPEQVKIGVWIMPNNKEGGMLETFLQPRDKKLWEFAEQSCKQAKDHGACFKDSHSDKAKIHTWLAWQDPPGRQLGYAIKESILLPDSPQAKAFMKWFTALFEV